MTTADHRVVGEDFLKETDTYRRELLAHCYRMLGSVHDAEDMVQETYLRAWRSHERFEGRSSIRTWLHRIATNACLTALDSSSRRIMPTALGEPNGDPTVGVVARSEVSWLEPVPDTMLESDADPASVVGSKESVRLAFIAALQHLPPRQRAVLVLRDVLKWKAAEVAEALETTTTAVNSILQRARAQLEQVTPTEDSVTEPTDAQQRALLDRYVKAFEDKDVAGMVELFTKDAIWEMPPFDAWFQGPDDIARLIDLQCPAKGRDSMRLVPTWANGQPAFGLYLRENDDEEFRPFNLPVLTMSPDGVSYVHCFCDLKLFETFGLPASLPADTPAA
ncbi:MAG: sigma-70 family RNA polymerase sigma factor [Streptosporangiales bacterium]|nr:sigma-70 family RNA polymerase sigma factor [Streptosporangiales bacterium]